MKKILILLTFVSLLTSCVKFDLYGAFIGYATPDERFDQSMKWNKEHPSVSFNGTEKGYCFLLGSDLHFDRNGATLSRFLSLANEQRVLFSLITGDLVEPYDGKNTEFSDSLSRYPQVTFLPVIGNHDLRLDNSKEFFDLFHRTVYLFTVLTPQCEDLFIVLDSGSSTLGKRQMQWLTGVLTDQRPNYRHCFVFSHADMIRPSVSTSTSSTYQREEQLKLLDLFAQHRVTKSFFGHGHEPSRTSVRGVEYIELSPLVGLNGRVIMSLVTCSPNGEIKVEDWE